MLIGIDLDHTVIDYQDFFYEEALYLNLIPLNHSREKEEIKKTIKKKHSEETWRSLQSLIYGNKISFAKSFEGVEVFFSSFSNNEMSIVSHKTKYSYINDFDLQKAAKKWLEAHSFTRGVKTIFTESLIEKCQYINNSGFTHFIDDLPEVLERVDSNTKKILFDPKNIHTCSSSYNRCCYWDEIRRVIQNDR